MSRMIWLYAVKVLHIFISFVNVFVDWKETHLVEGLRRAELALSIKMIDYWIDGIGKWKLNHWYNILVTTFLIISETIYYIKVDSLEINEVKVAVCYVIQIL